MSGTVFNFDKTEFPALYKLISDKIEDSDLIDIERMPESLHFKAIQGYLEESNMPVRRIGQMVTDKSPEDAEIYLNNTNVDLSPDEMAEEYRKKAHFYDHEKTGRDHHDRTVDALIEQAVDEKVFEGYDAVFKEVDYRDFESVGECLCSDADFIGVDLQNNLIELKEVKTSQSYDGRSERQRKEFEKAVEYANQLAGTEFDVQSSTVYASNIITTDNIVPNLYKGDKHVSGEADESDLSVLERFMDEMMYRLEFAEADQITEESPESYAESII